MILAQAVETSTGALVQTGGTVALAGFAVIAVRALFGRMTTANDKEIARLIAMLETAEKRADLLQEQSKAQNAIIQDRIIMALVQSNDIQARTLELLQKRERT